MVSGSASVKRCSLNVPMQAALGAGAVVGDQHHDRVVELADRLEVVDDPPDLRVGVGEETGEHLLLTREQPRRSSSVSASHSCTHGGRSVSTVPSGTMPSS